MSGVLSDIGGFAKGFGEGLWGGAKGMAQGIGSLAEGADNVATDPNARAQAWNDAVNAAQTTEWAVENPRQATSDIGQGATNLYNNFVTAEQQAAANGQGAEFWGNLAGQATFAAGTVLVPGLAEGKIAGALGEAGDASQALGTASTLEDAATALPDSTALSFVPENSGVAQSAGGQAWRDYQAQTLGSDMNPLTGEANVPALQFDNPNPNGNPYVKWDGFQHLPDGTTELIDAKTAISPFSTADGPFIPQSTLDQLVNKSAALDQNPGYSGVIEVPTQQAATDAQGALDQLGITNLDVRMRPFQDATAAATPNVAADASTTAVPTPMATTPAATDATSFPNAGNLFGAGLLGAGALGNTLSPAPQPDSSAATTPITPDPSSPLYSVTYGVNPDGSLSTLSPPSLVSPGDSSIAPPQPITPAPVDTTPAPIDTTPAPMLTSPAPIDTTPAPIDTTLAPVLTSPAPIDTTPAPIDTTPAPVDTSPAPTPDPTVSDPTTIDPSSDPSAMGDVGGGGGGGGGADAAAAMADD